MGNSATGNSDDLEKLFLQHYKPRKLRATSKGNTRLYKIAFSRFGQFLGRTPRLEDLDDDRIGDFLDWIVQDGRSPYTANCYRSKLVALWEHLARLRIAEKFPTVPKLKEPKRIPRAWSQGQLRALFNACERVKKPMGSIPGPLWWHSIHCVIWDTAERISAVLQFRWDDLDWSTGFLTSKAEHRKGQRSDMIFRIHPDTLAILEKLRHYSCGNTIFPVTYCIHTIYNRYEEILRDARLPVDRWHKFHCIRKSVASYVEAAGIDASKMLGHSSRRVTENHYLDPTIVTGSHASEVLFRP